MTANDLRLIDLIANRAAQLYGKHGANERSALHIAIITVQELTVVHHYIMPLDLERLFGAADVDFLHDIGGIHRHLDTGKLRKPPRLNDCFLPRFAMPQDEVLPL